MIVGGLLADPSTCEDNDNEVEMSKDEKFNKILKMQLNE